MVLQCSRYLKNTLKPLLPYVLDHDVTKKAMLCYGLSYEILVEIIIKFVCVIHSVVGDDKTRKNEAFYRLPDVYNSLFQSVSKETEDGSGVYSYEIVRSKSVETFIKVIICIYVYRYVSFSNQFYLPVIKRCFQFACLLFSITLDKFDLNSGCKHVS